MQTTNRTRYPEIEDQEQMSASRHKPTLLEGNRNGVSWSTAVEKADRQHLGIENLILSFVDGAFLAGQFIP